MEAVIVRIVGANDAWQGAADQARRRLTAAFGPQVQVAFYAASSPEIDRFPQALALIRLGDAPLPLVFIGDDALLDRRQNPDPGDQSPIGDARLAATRRMKM